MADSIVGTEEKKSKLWSLGKCFTLCMAKKRPLTAAQINRKKWKELGYKNEKQTLPPIFKILIDLYDGKDVVQALEDCRINPDYTPNHNIRNDLDYYIPQLTNFMILHEEFANGKLKIFLDESSKTDPYFAHLYYWYITSLCPDVNQEKTQSILDQLMENCSINSQIHLFLRDYERFYWGLERKLTKEEFDFKMKEIETRRTKAITAIHDYKTQGKDIKFDFHLRATDIELKPYVSPFTQDGESYSSNPFTSTLLFFEDLYLIAEEIMKTNDRLHRLKKLLHDLNKTLPSCVYIPFVKDSLRHYAILNIVVDETKVFSTKDRAPFCICLELFRPKEELIHEYNETFDIKEKEEKKKNLISWARDKIKHATMKIPYQRMGKDPLETETDNQFKLSKLNEHLSSLLTLKRGQASDPVAHHHMKSTRVGQSMIIYSSKHNNDLLPGAENSTSSPKHAAPGSAILGMPSRKLSHERRSSIEEIMEFKRSPSNPLAVNKRPSIVEEHKLHAAKEINLQIQKMELDSSYTVIEEEKDGSDLKGAKANENEQENGEEKSTRASSTNLLKDEYSFFGEDSSAQSEKIRKHSPFKDLKSWRVMQLIIKSGADLKEEQFALQLISQFDQIWKAAKIKLMLTPYEIVSLGTDIGVMEMLNESITLSGLKEKMYKHNISSLNEFFIQYFGKDVEKARRRFCRSLAAYSLVCYFLQIKDRHNGNIMLNKQGNIIHIDFGFMLSNAPGRGLEFEKKVPFKLLNEYVEVLGGPRSRHFQEFRKLFYKGFEAARKHSEQITILVKMMYSSHGNTLPCFKAGDRAITELEKRFFPPKVSDKDLTGFCYK